MDRVKTGDMKQIFDDVIDLKTIVRQQHIIICNLTGHYNKPPDYMG